MKLHFFLGLFLFLFVQINVHADDVKTLTSENFDSVVAEAEFIVVEFYAPWCGHCKQLAPEYETAAGILKDDDPPILLAKVDATEETDLAAKFDVRGYPTLKIFRKGKGSDYEGPRDANGIVSYLRKQAGPAAKKVTTAEQLEKQKSINEVLAVAFFDSEDELVGFRETANSMRDDFGFAEAPSSLAGEGQANKVVVFRSEDEAELVADTSDVESFIRANSIPLGGELTEQNRQRYSAAGLPILTVYIDVDYSGANLKHTNYFKRRIQKVAGDFAGKLSFTFADFSLLPDRSSIGGSDQADFVVGIEESKGKKFAFAYDKFNVQNLKQFAQDYLAGKLEPHTKSEPVPSDNSAPVTVVVGKTFESIVLDDSKDVLIEFYAPWCGHCKNLAPTYDKLGERFADKESVVIAKIDATANDHAGDFEVRGFPTIYFKPAGATPIQYSGARELDDFVSFIEKHATTL
jgi:protein disulfide isomerase